MSEYLAEDDVIDYSHPEITALAARLRAEHPGTTDFARAAFDFTRDEVKHSMDIANGRGGYFLHGMVAVYLDGEWHRQDPRGDKPGVSTEFSLTDERLAYHPREELGEADLDPILASPDPGLVAALRSADNTIDLVLNDGLPADLATREGDPFPAAPG